MSDRLCTWASCGMCGACTAAGDADERDEPTGDPVRADDGALVGYVGQHDGIWWGQSDYGHSIAGCDSRGEAEQFVRECHRHHANSFRLVCVRERSG